MKASVFLADDHAVVRFGLRAIIEGQADLAVAGEAEDGPAAVAGFLALRPDIGLIDLVLPQMDGATVCQEIHRELPKARLLILSASAPSESVHRALKAGAAGYVL